MMMNIQEKIEDISLMEPLSHTRYPEAELIRSYGGNSLAFFGLFPQNLHFLTPDGAGLVNYRLVNKVAVVLGDPVCAPEAIEKVVQSFLDYCAFYHWRVAFYQASAEYLPAIANVRISARRAERDGISIQWYEGVPPTTVMRSLEDVSRAWLEHKAGKETAETGFSTGRLDDVMESAELAERTASPSVSVSGSGAPRFVTAVVTTNAGTACAFVTFTPIYAAPIGEDARPGTQGWGWSLDLMRRTSDAPPGVMELVLVRALERFRLCGAQVVSMGLAALADTSQEMTAGQRQLVGMISDRLHMLEGRQTLFKFKQKFHPCWQSRYLVTNATLALPRVALAVLRLRNYSGGGVTRLVRGSDKS